MAVGQGCTGVPLAVNPSQKWLPLDKALGTSPFGSTEWALAHPHGDQQPRSGRRSAWTSARGASMGPGWKTEVLVLKSPWWHCAIDTLVELSSNFELLQVVARGTLTSMDENWSILVWVHLNCCLSCHYLLLLSIAIPSVARHISISNYYPSLSAIRCYPSNTWLLVINGYYPYYCILLTINEPFLTLTKRPSNQLDRCTSPFAWLRDDFASARTKCNLWQSTRRRSSIAFFMMNRSSCPAPTTWTRETVVSFLVGSSCWNAGSETPWNLQLSTICN